jgi:hypothetical protein
MNISSKNMLIMTLTIGVSFLFVALPAFAVEKKVRGQRTFTVRPNYRKQRAITTTAPTPSPASKASTIARTELAKDAAKKLASFTTKYLDAKAALRRTQIERERMFREQRSRDGRVSGEALKAMQQRVTDARAHVINAQKARNLYKNTLRLVTETKKILGFN